jgi:hypothetical protein
MIEPLIAAVKTFTYRYNPDNKNPPQEAFRFEDGTLTGIDPEVVQAIITDSYEDGKALTELLSEEKTRQVFANAKKGETLEDYKTYLSQTYKAFQSFLKEQVLPYAPDQSSDASPYLPEPF